MMPMSRISLVFARTYLTSNTRIETQKGVNILNPDWFDNPKPNHEKNVPMHIYNADF